MFNTEKVSGVVNTYLTVSDDMETLKHILRVYIKVLYATFMTYLVVYVIISNKMNIHNLYNSSIYAHMLDGLRLGGDGESANRNVSW